MNDELPFMGSMSKEDMINEILVYQREGLELQPVEIITEFLIRQRVSLYNLQLSKEAGLIKSNEDVHLHSTPMGLGGFL